MSPTGGGGAVGLWCFPLLSLVVWCRLASSSFEWCCLCPSSFGCCCFPSCRSTQRRQRKAAPPKRRRGESTTPQQGRRRKAAPPTRRRRKAAPPKRRRRTQRGRERTRFPSPLGWCCFPSLSLDGAGSPSPAFWWGCCPLSPCGWGCVLPTLLWVLLFSLLPRRLVLLSSTFFGWGGAAVPF